jgi:hypothetical protein
MGIMGMYYIVMGIHYNGHINDSINGNNYLLRATILGHGNIPLVTAKKIPKFV